MRENQFFKLTPLYKEFTLLNLIEKNPKFTKRELSRKVGSFLSMINFYIDEYESKGYLVRIYLSNKNIEYHLTKKVQK